MNHTNSYLFRVRTIKNGKKYTVQRYNREGNAIKHARKNTEYWVEGLIGKIWYELKI